MQSTQSPNSPARGDDRDGGENARRHQPRWRKDAGRFTGDLRVRHSRKSRSITRWVSLSSLDGAEFTIVPGRHLCLRDIPAVVGGL